MENLVLLVSTHCDAGAHVTPEWMDMAHDKILCSYCSRINRSIFPRPIDVELRYRPKGITAGIWFVGMRIFHRNFLDQIKEYLSDYILGSCYDSNGKLIPEYMTCYSDKYIVVRGTSESEYEICPECGTIGPMGWHAPPYVWRRYLSDARLYQNSSCAMFLDEDLALELDFSRWRNEMEFDLIPIRDEPIDGQHLPIDPPIEECSWLKNKSTFKP